MNKKKNPILDDPCNGWVSFCEDHIKNGCQCIFCSNQPVRLNPEDASVKTCYRSDDGVYEPLEPCICDSPTTENK